MHNDGMQLRWGVIMYGINKCIGFLVFKTYRCAWALMLAEKGGI